MRNWSREYFQFGSLSMLLNIPKTNRSITPGACQGLAIRAKDDRVDIAGVAAELPLLPPRGGVPQAYHCICPGTGDGLTIRAECTRVNHSPMAEMVTSEKSFK